METVSENYGTGKRKNAIARVYLRSRASEVGTIRVNGRAFEDYFPRPASRLIIMQVLELTSTVGRFDIHVNVMGGGLSGQAGAVKHGIASLVEGGTIRLHSRVNNDQLEVSVENGFDPESPKARSNGLGLRNVRQRLETRFGGRARFSAGVLSGSPLYRAEMTMPCKFE